MGYGTKALELLQKYYEMNIPNLDETEPIVEIAQVQEEEINLLEERIGRE